MPASCFIMGVALVSKTWQFLNSGFITEYNSKCWPNCRSMKPWSNQVVLMYVFHLIDLFNSQKGPTKHFSLRYKGSITKQLPKLIARLPKLRTFEDLVLKFYLFKFLPFSPQLECWIVCISAPPWILQRTDKNRTSSEARHANSYHAAVHKMGSPTLQGEGDTSRAAQQANRHVPDQTSGVR